ncbi:RHS repeat protein [Variovorax sp. PAMC26660]|uniref:RHS repeat protein n=1 Tax=Variovorax sp. PAMC26660 TaxID=2762322 RepID=UPI00164D6A1E|nr:RHS repeat protein [Variovorax sp. PAMC26660]QNK68444.1 RHS repeat protein [Variovorax sp. PAMC26660]
MHAFNKPPNAAAWTPTNNADQLIETPGGWTFIQSPSDEIFLFNATGKPISRTSRNGWKTTYAYDADSRLASISGPFGSIAALTYDTEGHLVTLTAVDGKTVRYAYDAVGRLNSVTQNDQTVRTYVYENTTFPDALTGIVDESGVRYATFQYDSTGWAISTEHAGGVGRYSFTYSTNGDQTYASVQDPLGSWRSYRYANKFGKLAVVGSSLPIGNSESRVQDANGFVTQETDFVGNKTLFSWDPVRRLRTSATRASGLPESQTTTVQWHPAFSMPALVTESGRTTAYTYDISGNVLVKTITDTATNKAQTWQYTYNGQGLVEAAVNPSNASTQYQYDIQGNITTATNSLGHVTSYTYDTSNRVKSVTAPNGLVTTLTYDLRDRVLTQTVGTGLNASQTTTFTYKPTGLLESASLSSGLSIAYTYDDAHRLIGWSNNRGESGIYTLDGMGNQKKAQIKDAAGVVAWQLARSVNSVNLVSGETLGENTARSIEYNANGEVRSETFGGIATTSILDGLGRATSISRASTTATLKYNALDAITEAKDFKGVVTAYGRDAQGNATSESSADTGGASTQYDNLGRPSQTTDALGQATTINRDALGRPTSLVFADGKTTTLRYDLTANSKGYLSEIVDRSGTTEYTRDAFGRVTLKKQTLINGSVQQVSYGYNANGTLASIGYPNGVTLSYLYDATGRLVGLNWNGNPLVTGIAWNPLGQPTAWTWAFTAGSPQLATSRAYDTAGRLINTEFGSYLYDSSGRLTKITQNLYKPGDTNPANSTLTNGNSVWVIDYDSLNRVSRFYLSGTAAVDSRYSYDANGNRTSSTRIINGQTTSRTYTVGAASNQLTGFTQSINGASNTSVTYGYNANGDMVSDGLRSYTYDAEGRLGASTTGATDTSPTTRYAHNALGQRAFKTEPLYPPSQGNAADPGGMQSLIAFFTELWNPTANQAEQLGYAYVYDEQGTLISEVGSGGTYSGGQAQYIYLPTANGPMPIAAVINGNTYAVHSDHLNTPRKLTDVNGQAAWQWSYSAFGEDKPTTAKNRFANLDITPNPGTTSVSDVKLNLRYPGQYADEESGLFYNYFRSYDARTGRYSQPDPIGLGGGWNRFGYVDGNPLGDVDPLGLAGAGKPDQWWRPCNGDQVSQCKASCTSQGKEYESCAVRWMKGKDWTGTPSGGGLSCSCKDSEAQQQNFCSGNCQRVLKTITDTATGLLIFTFVLVCATS